MYDSLLVPLDGSDYAEHALPYAVAIARKTGASLVLVRVAMQPRIALFSTETSAHVAAAARDYLGTLAQRWQRPDVAIRTQVLEGDAVAPTIHKFAHESGVDLVVATTHGKGTLGRLWLGSVTYELLRHVAVPLLLVRPVNGGGDKPDPQREPSLARMLLPLDGSPRAEHVLEPAVAFGRVTGAHYELLRVIDEIPFGAPELDAISLSSVAIGLLDEIAKVQKRVRKDAETYVEGVANRLRQGGASVTSRIAVASDAGNAILDAANELKVDLIALGSHGAGGVFPPVLGSVARKIVHGANKPILVQPTRDMK
jgi:nucleotide-binding universal stress UspA family protein